MVGNKVKEILFGGFLCICILAFVVLVIRGPRHMCELNQCSPELVAALQIEEDGTGFMVDDEGISFEDLDISKSYYSNQIHAYIHVFELADIGKTCILANYRNDSELSCFDSNGN